MLAKKKCVDCVLCLGYSKQNVAASGVKVGVVDSRESESEKCIRQLNELLVQERQTSRSHLECLQKT